MPDEIILTSDGSHTILSSRYGVTYHSRFGAIQESMHVFIQAGLHYKAAQSSRLSVLEMGFGTGLNALLTLIEAQRKHIDIDYATVEAFPLDIQQAAQLNFTTVLEMPELEETFQRMHRMDWGLRTALAPGFHFTKWKTAFEQYQPERPFDIIYFDAFAPGAQPELWELPLLEKMYTALAPGGVLTTYCAKGSVKRNLKSLGFSLEALEGPPGKREMTRAIKA
ncbi:MAG: tRNA (5-methylaminomethyl-2-thiouridine)(34)-methyltransferase MnmD [Saprospiraceae bacterium]